MRFRCRPPTAGGDIGTWRNRRANRRGSTTPFAVGRPIGEHGGVTEALDLYLASTSPRRRELLQRAGIRFALCEPGPEYVDAGTHEHDTEPGDPAAHAAARARRKAIGAHSADRRVPVLGVDTVVDLDGEELGKPRDRAAAAAMLARLAGRTHRVHTAHCLVVPATGRWAERLASATVVCGVPPAAELERYLASDQWRGKAGSYGLQDDAQGFLWLADGAFDTVVGLHVAAVRALLAQLTGGAA